MTPDLPEESFDALAAGRCPAPAVILLAIAAEFGTVDADAVLEQLDDAARPLFGLATHAPAFQAQRLVEVMSGELGFRGAAGWNAGRLLVDQVMREREGHPVVLATIATELCRRAGVPSGVYSSSDRWFVGLGRREALVLLDAGFDATGAPPPARVRRHCAHEIGFCVLTGLGAGFLAEQRTGDARRASEMRLQLPMSDGLLETVRQELQALAED